MWKVAKKVSLEPIPGGFFSGVPIRKLIIEGDKPSIKNPGPKNLSIWIPNETIQEFCNQQDGFVFNMTSSIKNYSPHSKVDSCIWKPFMVGNCKLEQLPPMFSVAEKFVRITQKFKITGNSSGMFQFICQHWKVKFNDQYYTRNDILTVHYGKNRPNPWPSCLSIIPEEFQTFVPVSKGSKVNVLIDKSKQEIDDPYPGSKIKLISEVFFDHSFQSLGSPLSVYRYGVSEDLESSESVYLKHKRYNNEIEKRAIIFSPFRENLGYRYFFVREPYLKAAVLTQGCNAVKLVTRTMLPMKVDDNCPATVSFISKIGDLSFYMINLHSPCPLVFIEKIANVWQVKCPL